MGETKGLRAGGSNAEREVSSAGRGVARASRVRVIAVRHRRERRAFIRLPWTIYRGDPDWVPPLLRDEEAFLDTARNPFFEHGDVGLFLALDGDRPVGRIAAIDNHEHTRIHRDGAGFFGLFESIDDERVSGALFDAASAWLAARDMRTLRGPMTLSINDRCGLLIRGFDGSPYIMMPYNPRSYQRLVEAAGFVKAKDVLAYLFDRYSVPGDRVARMRATLARRYDGRVRVRAMSRKRWNEDVTVLRDLFNRAWEDNWGFLPYTEREFDHLAASMKPVIDTDLVGILEAGGEPVGFGVALPDANLAIREANGRLLPLGIVKMMMAMRRVRRVRVPILGILPGYRGRGFDVLLYEHLAEHALRKGYHTAETSWILEDNVRMRRGIENFGGKLHRVYRIYERSIL